MILVKIISTIQFLLLDLYFSQLLRLKVGGATRDRTADPLLAKQVLSQLSYSPL